jgi:glycerol-3-phosphate acyltransferase PlsY
MPWLSLLLSAGIGYFIGSIPFGFLIAKARGIDIRQHGSGNIGATNVLRVVGKKEGIIAFILDFLKGLVSVYIGFFLAQGAPAYFTLLGLVAAVGVILGHNYTFWLGFKGGKGIATSAGALLALMPLAILVALVVWGIFIFATKMVSLASILAAVSLPITLGVLMLLGLNQEVILLPLSVAVAALAVWRHRANIGRIRRGEEPRIGQKKPAAAPAADPSKENTPNQP